jgi:nickel-dependent lactate racemase
LLHELEHAGVRDKDITLLCGVGMHRPSTRIEKINKLGLGIVERYHVVDNEPQNPLVQPKLGLILCGAPVQLHRAVIESDLVLATGIVEPHQYACYSGGSKTVAIGSGGESIISYTHCPDFIDHRGIHLGRLQGNPLQDVVTEVARRASLRFILNVVLDDELRHLRVQVGEPEQAFQALVTFARSIFEVPIPRQYDIAIAGVGFPKNANLYQASRAASYLLFAPTQVVRSGGFVIILARCQ